MNARTVCQLVGGGLLAVGFFAWTSRATTAGGPPIRLTSGTGYIAPEAYPPGSWTPPAGLIPTHWESSSQLIPTEIQAKAQLVTSGSTDVALAETGILITGRNPSAVIARMNLTPTPNQQRTQFLNEQFGALLFPARGDNIFRTEVRRHAPWAARTAPLDVPWVTKRPQVATVPQSPSK